MGVMSVDISGSLAGRRTVVWGARGEVESGGKKLVLLRE